MSLDTARLPLLGNIQQTSYGSALDARAENQSYVVDVEAEPKQTEQGCVVVIVPESNRDDRIFKTWTVFRRVGEFLDPKDRPSMLSVSVRRPEWHNASLVRHLIIDDYLREQMPQKTREEIYKFIQNPLSVNSNERDHLLNIMSEYFPNLDNLSIAEENALWDQIRENSRALNADLDGSPTFQAITDLHKNVVLMLRLFRATTKWGREGGSESMQREMRILFNNLKRDIVTFGNSTNRVMAATSKVGRWETAFLFDVMKKEMEALQNLRKWFTQREFFNIHRDLHILRCAALFEKMIKTMQERQYISEENVRPRLIEVCPGEESKTYRLLLQNPSIDRLFWRPWEINELNSLMRMRCDKNGLLPIITRKNEQVLVLNLPGNEGEQVLSVKDFTKAYKRKFWDRLGAVLVFALNAGASFPLFAKVAGQKPLMPIPPASPLNPMDAQSLVYYACPNVRTWEEEDSAMSGDGSWWGGSGYASSCPANSFVCVGPAEVLPWPYYSNFPSCDNILESAGFNCWPTITDLQQGLLSVANRCIQHIQESFQDAEHELQMYRFLKYYAPLLVTITVTALFVLYRWYQSRKA